MKFTPEQVEQLLAESGANCVRSNPSQADEVYEAYFYELARLCTLAADRALEAAAYAATTNGVDGIPINGDDVVADWLRAMKGQA